MGIDPSPKKEDSSTKELATGSNTISKKVKPKAGLQIGLNDRLAIANTLLNMVLAIGVFLTFQSLNAAYKQQQLAYIALVAEHEQKRREYTMHLYDEWRAVLDSSPARETLELLRSNELISDDLPYIVRGVEIPKKPKYDVKQIIIMRHDFIAILNLFEQIAVADQVNVGDSEMIREYFSKTIVPVHYRLKSFIDEWRDKERRQGWRPLDEVVNKLWKQEIQLSKPSLFKS